MEMMPLGLLVLNPPSFHFWFTVELFKYVIISLIIYLAIKYTRFYIIIPVFLAWCIEFYVPFVNTEALLFFFIGSYFGIHKKESIINYKFSSKIILSSAIVWLIILSIKIGIAAVIGQEGAGNLFVLLVLHKISVILGILTIWYGFDLKYKNEIKDTKILKLSSHTFFIYAFHEPFMNIVFQTILYKIKPSSILNLIINYIVGYCSKFNSFEILANYSFGIMWQ